MTQVLSFCCRSGLINLDTTSIDGTKIKANASPLKNRSERWIEEEIARYLRESEETDSKEDELYGLQGHKNELLTQEERLRKLQEFKEILANERRKKLENHKEKLEERKRQESRCSKRRGRKPLKAEEVEERIRKKAKVNLTDPESRIMKTNTCYLQGYNAQAVVSDDQVIIAAEVTQECNDGRQLRPMIEATKENLHEVDKSLKAKTLLEDAGYFSSENVKGLKTDDPDVLSAVSKEYKNKRKDEDEKNVIPMPLTPASLMEYRLHTKEGKRLYRKRSITVEPVFGHIKEVLGFDRFMRRGLLNVCICEWKLKCTVHNILKLWRYGFNKVRKTCEAKAIFIGTGQDQDIEAIAL